MYTSNKFLKKQEVNEKMSTAQKTTRRTRKPKATPLSVMEAVHCHICGEINSADESVEFDGKFLCSRCCDNETSICEKCRVRVWNDDNSGDYDTRLCKECYESDYTRCGDCGIVLHNDNVCRSEDDNTEPYCYYCYSRPLDDSAINNYSYKPQPIFYGDTAVNRYFGVELEIDDGGRDSGNAHHILQVANRTAENIYVKSDGSLNNGFEIVTHPMTLDYHRDDMAWRQLTQKALRLGYKSHETNTCGMHVHVNRDTFTDDQPSGTVHQPHTVHHRAVLAGTVAVLAAHERADRQLG